MHRLFPHAVVYDEPLKRGTRTAVNKCDAAFVCVPTPSLNRKELDITIVEDVVAWLQVNLIILRSTVNPGTTDRLRKTYSKRLVFQPEYLGETVQHAMSDISQRSFLVLGGVPIDRRSAIEIYQSVYNSSVKIRQTDALTAEIIKLAENRAIAHKVAEAQELYDLCETVGVDYYTVREAVYHDDPRMSPHWTFVYPNKRGFDSKCIPKDVFAITAYARTNGSPMPVTEAVLARNDYLVTLSDTS